MDAAAVYELPFVVRPRSTRSLATRIYRTWRGLGRLKRTLMISVATFLLIYLSWTIFAQPPPHAANDGGSNDHRPKAAANDQIPPGRPPFRESGRHPDPDDFQPAEPAAEEPAVIDDDAGAESNAAKKAPPPPPDAAKPAPKSELQFTGARNDRQRAVVGAFRHAWRQYANYAWGHDTLKPVSKGHADWFGIGLTILDGLDTAIMMGLSEETAAARKWIENDLSFDKNSWVNTFETTIRALGGLLSAYHLTGDQLYVKKAEDLAERLVTAFYTESGVPNSDVNLRNRKSRGPVWSGSESSLSEATTLQLEFRDISRLTGNKTYEQLAFRVSELVHADGCTKYDGLCGLYIDTATGKFREGGTITLGARTDSYYEYLLKQWLQTGKTIDWLKQDWERTMAAMERLLVHRSSPHNLTFVGELLATRDIYSPKMDHLVCFVSGSLALGYQHGIRATKQGDLELAKAIGETCYKMYDNPTGLGPEIAHFNEAGAGESGDLYVKPLDAHSLLRPEAIEAWFYLYRITGDTKYQDWGWRAFEAIEKYARLSTGYSSVHNVKRIPVTWRDNQESFFLAETLKYLYLLFDDTRAILPLDRWVFNTEAHPLPIRDS